MKIIISGGTASGKSAHAERILCENSNKRLYIATMQPFGEEAKKRIERHKKLRYGKGFDTIECFTKLKNLKVPRAYDGILIECMSNLLANEMFSSDGAGAKHAINEILCGIEHIEKQCQLLVIVTNDVFGDGNEYSNETTEYLKLLGELNYKLCENSSYVFRSICGILLSNKGEMM